MNIQERFYSFARRVENILSTEKAAETSGGRSSVETRVDNAEIITLVKKQRIKFPEASLPTFDGKYENWLSFKNAFQNMIGSQTDLSDIDKLHYLKSAFIGETANKIRIFAVDGVNYANTWDILERSYKVKRILISRHF